MESPKLNIEDLFIFLADLDYYDKIIFGIGNICKLAYEKKIYPPKAVYMTSGWGCIAGLGIGMSLGKKERNFLVIDGDGSFLHSPSFLITIKSLQITNLHIVIIQNEIYESTGGQPIKAFKEGLNLANIIKGYDFKKVIEVVDNELLQAAFSSNRFDQKGPHFTIIKAAKLYKTPPRIPHYIVEESFKIF